MFSMKLSEYSSLPNYFIKLLNSVLNKNKIQKISIISDSNTFEINSIKNIENNDNHNDNSICVEIILSKKIILDNNENLHFKIEKIYESLATIEEL